MNTEQLRDTLKIDEGVKYEIYNDHLGYPTFGIGHLIVESDNEYGQPVGTGIHVDRVNEAFDKDVSVMVDEAKKIFSDFDNLPEEAQQVIVNMTFNMGRPRLSKFKKFIAGVEASDWEKAAVEMMDSRWATQVGARAERLRDRIRALA